MKDISEIKKVAAQARLLAVASEKEAQLMEVMLAIKGGGPCPATAREAFLEAYLTTHATRVATGFQRLADDLITSALQCGVLEGGDAAGELNLWADFLDANENDGKWREFIRLLVESIRKEADNVG